MNAERLLAHYEKIADAFDAVPRLRRFVLDLAVRGKLVPQAMGDEPPKGALNEARDRLATAAATTGRLRWKVSVPVVASEIDRDIPSGWVAARINDTGLYVNGLAFKPSDWKKNGLPIIRIQNLTDPGKEFNFAEGDFPDEVLVHDGDLLVSWSATLEAFKWNRGRGVLNQHIFRVIADKGLTTRNFLLLVGAAIIGFAGERSGVGAFAIAAGGHDAGGAGTKIDEMFEGEVPEHVRPTIARAVAVAATWLPLWLGPVVAVLLVLGPQNVFSQIAVFFSTMAVVTFGGAYAVLAYVAQQAVQNYHWLKPGEMLDGLGMAETTPGPLIMVLQFVGFMAAYRDPGPLAPMLAATLGGLLATWVTFAPCFFWIFLGAPFVEKLRGNRALNAALSAITAAVVGVILNLAIWFAIHTIFRQTLPLRQFGLAFDAPIFASVDPWSLVLVIAAAVAVFRFNIGMIATLAGCSIAAVALYEIGALA